MTQHIYYRPEWTCGRYNPQSQVALMYNLIEGKSFFFESHSAAVIAEILSTHRNDILDISDMEDYFKLTSRETWIFDLFEEVYASLTRSSGDLL